MPTLFEPSVPCKQTGRKGKENAQYPAACPVKNKEKQSVCDIKLKSKLPVLSKAKPPPDFHKMHQAWQNQFQKGKAVSKKSCTRPQPFNFAQKGERFRVAAASDVEHSAALFPTNRSSVNQLDARANREPLGEVCLGQQNPGNSRTRSKDVPETEFKADPVALASILSNAGVSTVPGVLPGKLSLAQRVPVRMSSTAASISSFKSTMVRNSLYTTLGKQTKCTTVNRMSCFSMLPTKKGQEQRTPSRQKPEVTSPPPDIILKKCPTSKNDCIQSQVNPVLQQMNPLSHIPVATIHSFPVGQTEIVTRNQCLANPINKDLKQESADTAFDNTLTKQTLDHQTSLEHKDNTKDPNNKPMPDPFFGDFVEDPQALASIISNTGVTVANGGKLSLVQRVPVRSKHVEVRNSMIASGSAVGQGMTPKPTFGRMSTIPFKNGLFSPSRVLQAVQTPRSSSGIQARRIPNLKSPGMKFSQTFNFKMKQPVFPKTPKAIAVEMANKLFEAEFTEPQTSSKSSVKWADQLSPAIVPEAFCKKESNLGQVAVRLFSDCTGYADKEGEMPITVLDTMQNSDPCKKDHVVPERSAATNRLDPQALPLHQQLAPLSIQEPSPTFPLPTPPSIVQEVKMSLPLSFLSHPAVQALKSGNDGPRSLPHIAQMRLKATMSAKTRFWDTCLDDECAFYTSLGASGSSRSCADPVASSLEKQENMHFIPIAHEEREPTVSDG